LFDFVIKDGTVIDGSGSPGVKADLAIQDGIVAEVGHVENQSIRKIDAKGKVVTPGFIDLHTHSDNSFLIPSSRRASPLS
jgi:N-acyl-D-aspartate/D-glutamate deacylase